MVWFKTQSVKSRKNLILELTQENLIEFLVQSIYLVYTGLMVHTTLNLAHPKKYALFIRSICIKHAI